MGPLLSRFAREDNSNRSVLIHPPDAFFFAGEAVGGRLGCCRDNAAHTSIRRQKFAQQFHADGFGQLPVEVTDSEKEPSPPITHSTK